MALDEIGGERRKAAFFDCGDPAAAVDRLAPSQTAALAEVAAHLEGIQGTQLAGGERKAKRKS